ncbi:MAG: dTDP-4-amino-4,6-dideoxygalactose transaminase [bacterium]|nr:dTDP-4-amino-4,6-dideoxygalactose transaminase [bacterium]
MKPRIPFNKPFIAGGELEHIAESVRAGRISGGGPYMKRCEEYLEEICGAPRVLLTTSCTAAMEMAALLCDLGPEDEVILPSYTFVSTANAVLLRGARPVFVDIRRDTKNLDENLVEAAITERTKAIMPVHYAGIGCEMDALVQIAAAHDLRIIEDAAQGLGACYKGQPLGGIGDFGAFSFHETKNVICGEGGALVLNRPEDVERAEILREKGTDRAKFFRGEIDKYTWVDVGSSYVSSDLLAAFLWGQFEQMDRIAAKRRSIAEAYFEQLAPLAAAGHLELPVVPNHCDSNHHIFYVLPRDMATRTALIAHLRARSILAVFHYVPLHASPMGQRLGYEEGMFPVTEDVSARLLRLPFYFELTPEDQAEVTTAITEFFGERT